MSKIIKNIDNGNQYILHAKVGQGAYGEVYRGQNTVTKQVVAVKKMAHMRTADSAMAQKQVQLMKVLNHKNIVRWIDDFKDKGVWYIVLEYCGKGDLQKYKEKVGKIPEQNCKLLIRGILQALVELHSQKRIIVEINKKKVEVNKKKIAHRDLKLPNILINDQFQLKLADFGFSKDLQSEWLKSFCGSPVTMAPQVLKRQKYNEKCDVWSLGVITYYLLYDKYPYFPQKGDGAGIMGMINVVTNKIHKFDPNVRVSDACKDFINSCLIKPFDKRPYSHQLIKHPWIQGNLRWTYLRQVSIKKSLQQNPVKQAEIKLKNVLYESSINHIKKLVNALFLDEQKIKNNLAIFQKYYSVDNSQVINYYKQLVKRKLAEFEKTQIMLNIYAFQRKNFSFQPSQINKFKKNKLPFDLQNVTINKEIDIGEQLMVFLADETQKLMDLFSQSEVNQKRHLFLEVAQFVTAKYDYSLINIEWGKRQDLDDELQHVNNAILGLSQQTVVDMINQELPTKQGQNLESIWTIQYHISQTNNDKDTTEYQIGKLVLSILQIGSNFNVDSTMATQFFEINNNDFNQFDFLEIS